MLGEKMGSSLVVGELSDYEFDKNSSKTVVLDKDRGISAIIGRPLNQNKTETQSFIFEICKNWDLKSALEWVTKNGNSLKKFDLSDALDIKALSYISENKEDLSKCSIIREYNPFIYKSNSESGIMEIKGYLSTFKNVDRHGDIVDERAFVDTLKGLKKLPLQRNHSNRTEDQLGAWTKFKVDEKGLYVEGFISKTKNTEHERKLIEDGALDTLSMGGIMRYSDTQVRGKNLIVSVTLFEGSIVSMPANTKATFEVKSLIDTSKQDQVVAESTKDHVVEIVEDRVKRLIKTFNDKRRN